MRLIWLDQDDSEADEGAVTPTVPPKIWFLFRTPTCSYRNNHLPIVELTLFNWRKLPGRSQTPPLPQIRNWNLNLIEFAENINLNLRNVFFIISQHCILVSEIKLCICLSPTLPHPTTSLQLYLLPLVSNILFQIVTIIHPVPFVNCMQTESFLRTDLSRRCCDRVVANHDRMLTRITMTDLEFLAMVTKLLHCPHHLCPFTFDFSTHFLPLSKAQTKKSVEF